jgi:hypothetical protein
MKGHVFEFQIHDFLACADTIWYRCYHVRLILEEYILLAELKHQDAPIYYCNFGKSA